MVLLKINKVKLIKIFKHKEYNKEKNKKLDKNIKKRKEFNKEK